MAHLHRLMEQFTATPAHTRPMVRWWWFGPQVDRAGITAQLRQMRAAGFGGAELSFVYPLTEESGRFGSREFGEYLDFTAATAADLGLRLDVTGGSGWSYGGPHIGPEHAARGLCWESREIGPGPLRLPRTGVWPGDELLAAFEAPGAPGEARPADFEPVPMDGDGVRVPPGSGPRVLLLAWSALTGQQVKRAAAGAEGPVLDHYSAGATRAHIEAVVAPILAAAGPDRIGALFCDSLEVYGSDFTPELPAEFTRRRGYDPLPMLHLLHLPAPGHEAFRADYYRTLSELYSENFVGVLGTWAAQSGTRLRIQNYGEPPATISSYRHADEIEGEGWDWLGLPQTRWAAAAAHRYGRQVVSAEAFTWIHSPSLRATPLDLKGEAHEHLLSGVNQFYLHGWPYHGPEDPGVGHLFYAAGAFDERNPWWPAMPHLSAYLTRLSWLLQQGRPVADVAVLVPAAPVYAQMGTGGPFGCNLWRGTARALGDIPARIRTAGLDFDLLDDDALAGLDPQAYRAVVVPGPGPWPSRTAEFLRAARAAGVLVLPTALATDHPDTAAPDQHEPMVPVDMLGPALVEGIGTDWHLRRGGEDVGVVHRDLGALQLYLLVNTGNEPVQDAVRVRQELSRWALISPERATVHRAGVLPEAGTPWIGFDLPPYGAVVLVTSTDEQQPWPGTSGAQGAGPAAPALDDEPAVIEPRQWQVGPPDGPGRPVSLPHRWEADDDVPAHQGSMRYRATLTFPDRLWPADPGEQVQVWLDFGPTRPTDPEALARRGLPPQSFRARVDAPVREVVEVLVDGEPAGVLWAPPYRLDLTDAMRKARPEGGGGPDGAGRVAGDGHAGGDGQREHRLDLLVHSVGARAVAADTGLAARIDAVTARHGVRFRMQDLPHATSTVVSGLTEVPRVVVHRSTAAQTPEPERADPLRPQS